jgi:hypothetical protein
MWNIHFYFHHRTAFGKWTALPTLSPRAEYQPKRVKAGDGDIEKRRRGTTEPQEGKFIPTIIP